MKIPKARYGKHKNTSDIMYFLGYNASSDFKLEELKNMKNLSSNEYPLLSIREPREVVMTLTTPKYLFASEKLCYVDGLDFYWDGVKKGTLTIEPKSIIDFNKYIIIFPSKQYYDYVNDTWGTFTSPDIDYATVSNNRIFGVKGSELFACKLGDFKSWESFQGLSTDSFAADVATKGDFNGITNYANHVTMFKNEFMHELYGNKPSNYSIPEAFKSGSVGNESISEVKGYLLFAGDEGVKLYSGGIPRVISNKLNKIFVSASAGTDGKKYYISIYDGTSYELFVYDLEYDMWHKEDNLEVINFAYYQDHLYALATDGKVYKFNSGTEVISWELETQIFTENPDNKKHYKTVYINIELEQDSEITVYIKKNDYPYMPVKTILSHGHRSYKIPINVQDTHHFQILIKGVGKAKIHNITREFIIGGDV